MTLDDRTRDGLLDDCRRMTADIAPELVGRYYLLDLRDLDGRVPQHISGLGGVHIPPGAVLGDMDGVIKDFDGPRCLIALNLSSAEETTCGDLPSVRAAVLTTMCHELAHALPFRAPCPLPMDHFTAEHRQRVADSVLARCVAEPIPEPSNQLAHGAEFCRVASHLWARARFCGWDVALSNLLAGGPAALFDGAVVFSLLGEAHRMTALSFAEILEQPPSEAFETAWRSVLHFHEASARRAAERIERQQEHSTPEENHAGTN